MFIAGKIYVFMQNKLTLKYLIAGDVNTSIYGGNCVASARLSINAKILFSFILKRI
jgi:hypothetical protein